MYELLCVCIQLVVEEDNNEVPLLAGYFYQNNRCCQWKNENRFGRHAVCMYMRAAATQVVVHGGLN